MRLKDLCKEFIVPQRDKPKEFGGSIPWCRIEDIDGKYLNGTKSNQFVSNETIRKMNLKVIPEGSVICSCSASLGVQAILTKPCITNQTFIGIVPQKELSSELLFYFLKSKTEYFKKIGSGTTIPYISRKKFEELSLPEQLLNCQNEIVSILSKVENQIALRKSELALLDNLIKARFVELFGDPIQNPYVWEKKRFDEICENLDSRRKPITSSDRVEGIYPYYGASGIVDYVEDYIFDEDILLVSEDGANLLMRSTPIAFSVSGKVWVNNHAHVVRFDKMCLQKYIEIFFSLIDISDSITGSAQPKLNQAKLNAMEFPIPNESLLEDYLRFLKQVDKSKSVVKESLDETQMLFDSLMQEYFG